jgi:hypothetical protein
MKPVHYAVFLGLLGAGLGASVLLVPHQDELGMIFFKARQYPEARRILEERLAGGTTQSLFWRPWQRFWSSPAMWTR